MRPLFLIGNKRSGTSHLTRLLNLHPDVFVTHESDAIWLLYQWARNEGFRCYPWDGPAGMEATLAVCADLLTTPPGGETARSVPDLFEAMQRRLMAVGSAVQQPYPEKQPTWIGDKKPAQQADPVIHRFIEAHLPGARYVHLIRHPKAVVASMRRAGRTWAKVPYWRSSPAAILERWATHERWVLAVKAAAPERVLTTRFEDLTQTPADELRRILAFLELDESPATASATAGTHAAPNDKYDNVTLALDEPARALMRQYGYA